ncbi:hypothetical protein [Salinibacter ruber]|uniref:Uncharacterized protein n=1 Tax=Salinibacter ruber TaxID=146919 RepID=A0AAW5P731_9BACT|nr:hypothetical protein [Salinibacter ruber]MCS4157753.1 hypothetical protein [Salinibacter ruber]
MSTPVEEKIEDQALETLSDAITRRAESTEDFPFGWEQEEEGPEGLAALVSILGMTYSANGGEDWKEEAKSVIEEVQATDADPDTVVQAASGPALRDFVLFMSGKGPMPDEFWAAKAGRPSVMEIGFPELEAMMEARGAGGTVEDRLEKMDEESGLIDVVEVRPQKRSAVLRLEPEVEEEMASAVAQDIVEDAGPHEPVDLISGESVGTPVDSGLDFETAILYAKGAGANRTVNQLEMLRSTYIEEAGPQIKALRKHLYRQMEYPVIRRLQGEPSAQEIAADGH